LGPNGAGKTTTVEIMEGITSPTTGVVQYRGAPRDNRFREEVGIQFQTTALQDFLTVKETLDLFHRLYEHTANLNEIISVCSLEELLARDNRKLSGGQRQRLLLALALLNDYMEEAYRLCDEIIIMDHGKIIAEGSPAELLAEHFDETILQLPTEDFTAPADRFPFTVLQGNGCVEISIRDVDAAIRQLQQNGISLQRLVIRPRTLDDLFLELTGKELRP
jgi:ABC-2 type transport system ATP-binding protein